MPYFEDKLNNFAWFKKYCEDNGLKINFVISEMIQEFRDKNQK